MNVENTHAVEPVSANRPCIKCKCATESVCEFCEEPLCDSPSCYFLIETSMQGAEPQVCRQCAEGSMTL